MMPADSLPLLDALHDLDCKLVLAEFGELPDADLLTLCQQLIDTGLLWRDGAVPREVVEVAYRLLIAGVLREAA